MSQPSLRALLDMSVGQQRIAVVPVGQVQAQSSAHIDPAWADSLLLLAHSAAPIRIPQA